MHLHNVDDPTLLGEEEGVSPRGAMEPPQPGDIEVMAVEHSSRVQVDYYAVTAACDLLSFVYVACFYQVCISTCAAQQTPCMQ